MKIGEWINLMKENGYVEVHRDFGYTGSIQIHDNDCKRILYFKLKRKLTMDEKENKIEIGMRRVDNMEKCWQKDRMKLNGQIFY